VISVIATALMTDRTGASIAHEYDETRARDAERLAH
jgi:hypothetical protein